eukprot:TRINITY_DN9616_c0_g1_i1.p1 TRINITY_DN9616_c0_g1~~TRINITY_DN9616_c0_g1_i1.p1  ORF type:complete len:759 (+),score=217.75 TRINITY_DN9616_c0_g1_i1:77-2278(+)
MRAIFPGQVFVTPARSLGGHDDDIMCLHVPAWAEGGGDVELRVITGSADGTARLFNPFEPHGVSDEVAPDVAFRGHAEAVSAVGTLRDGKRIFTASHDGTLKEWTCAGEEVHTYEGHEGPVLDLVCMPDELYSASSDCTVIAWHTRTRKRVRDFTGHTGPVVSLHLTGERGLVTASADGTLRLWARKDGAPVQRVYDAGGGPIGAVSVHAPSDLLVAATFPNPAAPRLPEAVASAAELKSRARRLSEQSTVEPSCRCWTLSSAWDRQRFPGDVTCLLVHSAWASGPARSATLISGHNSGECCAWLIEGSDATARRLQGEVDVHTARLDALEAKLEELRVAERFSMEVYAAQKAARRCWFGLTQLFTSAHGGIEHRPGLCAIQEVSKQPVLASDRVLEQAGRTALPGLHTLLANSINQRPELLWSGLVVLDRHCAAGEADVARAAKDAVDAVREEIAVVRQAAVVLDRKLSAYLRQGQLYRRFKGKGLLGPVTAVAAAGKMVYAAASGGDVWGWDLGSGHLLERLHGLGQPLRVLTNYGGRLLGAGGRCAAVWCPPEAATLVPPPPKIPPPPRVVAPPPEPDSTTAVLHRQLRTGAGALLTEQQLREAFARFDADSNGRISREEFMAFWDSLEHCGTADHRREAEVVLRAAEARRLREEPLLLRAAAAQKRHGTRKHADTPFWGSETPGGTPPPLVELGEGAAARAVRKRREAARAGGLTFVEFSTIMLRYAAR